MSPANGKIPAGWRIAKLGDICAIQNGFAFNSQSFSRSAGKPLIRIRDLKTNIPSENYDGVFSDVYLVSKDDLLVGMDGEFRCYEWLGPQALLNQRVCRLIPNPDMLDRSFLLFSINSYLREIEEQTSFTTVKHVSSDQILGIELALPPLVEQGRIATRLREELVTVSQARTAFEAQLVDIDALLFALIRESLNAPNAQTIPIADCMREVTEGIGELWRDFPVLGATRAGLAPAKEGVGKNPGRYKPVRAGTIFYNPMRILLGSIAIVDEDDTPGITSPDYVVATAIAGILHPLWFYYWFRSSLGAEFIKSLTRGAVRERLLFNRLAKGVISVPDWRTQLAAITKFREIKKAKIRVPDRLAEIGKLPAALLSASFE